MLHQADDRLLSRRQLQYRTRGFRGAHGLHPGRCRVSRVLAIGRQRPVDTGAAIRLPGPEARGLLVPLRRALEGGLRGRQGAKGEAHRNPRSDVRGGPARSSQTSTRSTSADGSRAMAEWLETCRSVVSPWECDITEHFTIAYYFDRLADAAATIEESLGLRGVAPSAGRRFDVRFVRELRAGASFHILSAPIKLDNASVRLGHQILDSGNGEVTARVEQTLDWIAGRDFRAHSATVGDLGRPRIREPAGAEHRRRLHPDGARPHQAGRSRCRREGFAGRLCPPLHRRPLSKR